MTSVRALGTVSGMMCPKPRGSLSERVRTMVRTLPSRSSVLAPLPSADSSEDEALALWILHELSYGGFEDVDERAEQHPAVLAVRSILEDQLEERLRARCTVAELVDPGDVPDRLIAMVEADDGPSLADHVRRHADRDEVLELLRQRSVYHLKESDPTAWVVPRLPVRAKAALVELQYDEYGAGNPNRLHSHLFARGLASVGLDPDYGAFVDEALPETLEMNNAASLFGLHRRLRGAAMGHLAAFEMTSSLPSRKMVQGLDRLALDAVTCRSTTASTWRPTPSTSTWPHATSAARWPRTSPSRPMGSSSVPSPAWTRSRGSPRRCSIAGVLLHDRR